MGFLSFKKKKTAQDIDLDVPPAPPKAGIWEEKTDIEELPLKELPDLPPLPEIKKKKKPFLLFRKKKAPVEPKLPPIEEPELPKIPQELEFPEIPKEAGLEKEEILPRIPPLETKPPEPLEEKPLPTAEEEEPEKPLPVIKEEEPEKIKFLSLNDFRTITQNIEDIRQVLKSTIFSEIDEVNKNKEQKYEEWHSCLEDVQRKIMFVDKTIFKEQTV